MDETQIKNLQIDNEAYQNQIAELKSEIAELKKDNDLRKEIKTLIKTLESIPSRKSLEKENARLKKQIEAINKGDENELAK